MVRFHAVCYASLWIVFSTLANAQTKSIVYQVTGDDIKECCTPSEKKNLLPPIYCYSGNEKSVLNVFQTIMVDLMIDKTEDYIIYQDVNQELVKQQMLSDEATFSFNKILSYFWKQKEFKLDPFQLSCFSIKTNVNFKIKIRSIALDNRRLLMFLVGLFLFGYSARLSYNSLFYYLCGITIGVTASLLIIIILISRLIPKKKMMIGYLGASCMLSLYAIQMFAENLNMILLLYYKYILGYIVFSMLVSFVVCYRYGPVTNPRSIDLIRWTLQLLGLILVTTCSFHLEAMVLVDVLSILFYYTKCSLLPVRLLPRKRPIPKLLSEEEYIQQSLTETPKALEELRKYCRSPNCDTWKVVSRLRDPKMFGEFMETSAHISAEAVEEYEKEFEEDNEDIEDMDTTNPFQDSSDNTSDSE